MTKRSYNAEDCREFVDDLRGAANELAKLIPYLEKDEIPTLEADGKEGIETGIDALVQFGWAAHGWRIKHVRRNRHTKRQKHAT